jgi:hypothetical protein
MKKYVVLATLLVVVAAHGFKRECTSGSFASRKKTYTYSIDILSAQDMPVMCFVTLIDPEKDFIRRELAAFSAVTPVTRKFYKNNIKNKYDSSKPMKAKGETKNKIIALRRVTRDFGGSKKRGRATQTVGDILKMLDGKLKDIGTEQSAF